MAVSTFFSNSSWVILLRLDASMVSINAMAPLFCLLLAQSQGARTRLDR